MTKIINEAMKNKSITISFGFKSIETKKEVREKVEDLNVPSSLVKGAGNLRQIGAESEAIILYKNPHDH